MTVKDCTSVKEFWQLKKEIRGSKDHLIVGIDVAKDDHKAFFGTANGKTLLKRLTFKNDIEGFEKLLARVKEMKVKHSLDELVLGLEPTANYHKPLGDFLIKCGHMVVLVSGVSVKRNRELLDGRWDKNDTKDSANVADLISQGKCLYYEYAPVLLKDLRGLLSLKRRLKKQEHGLRIRIRNSLLAQYFPELDKYYSKWEPEVLSVVRWCLDPSVIAGLEYDQFVSLVCPGSKNIRQQGRLEWIWKKAVDSIGCDAGEAAEFEAKVMVEELRHIREVIKETDAKIKDVCVRFPEYDYPPSAFWFHPFTCNSMSAPHRCHHHLSSTTSHAPSDATGTSRLHFLVVRILSSTPLPGFIGPESSVIPVDLPPSDP